MFCPARSARYENGNTSGLVIYCGGTVSFTKTFVYLCSPLHNDLTGHCVADARIKKAF
jgi:hypothetical protein